MIKEYEDTRINELIKKSFERATKDSEWSIRSLSEWNLLYECIDKVLDFVASGKTKELYINRNMWYILQDTFFDILDLYGVDIQASEKVSEKELLIPKREKVEISQETRNYLKIICNFLNNTKGYITRDELDFLLMMIEDRNHNITNAMLERLNALIECDEQEEFIEELLNIEMESYL